MRALLLRAVPQTPRTCGEPQVSGSCSWCIKEIGPCGVASVGSNGEESRREEGLGVVWRPRPRSSVQGWDRMSPRTTPCLRMPLPAPLEEQRPQVNPSEFVFVMSPRSSHRGGVWARRCLELFVPLLCWEAGGSAGVRALSASAPPCLRLPGSYMKPRGWLWLEEGGRR